MEFIGLEFANWKELLLGGLCRATHAAQAGEILGTIHRRTAGDAEVARKFKTTADFRQLRLEPYLLTTGARHPDLREFFESEAGRLAATHEALVHGDFSPKNIMISDTRMVVLDCEVAWYGDPTFDVAFLLNHFFLKALHHAPTDHGLEKMVAAFWQAYSVGAGKWRRPDRGTTARPAAVDVAARARGRQITGGISDRAEETVHP